MTQKRSVAMTRYAEYNCAIRYFLENGLGVTCILQPELTARTMELGTQNSPDFVCTPFKTTLGSMIEALEVGANTLIMVQGSCKLGYYGELQERILRDMGYQFDFINLAEYNTGKKKDYIKAIKRINPDVNMAKVAVAALEAVKMVEHVDEITGTLYKNRGFARNKAEFDRAYRRFLSDMYAASSKADIEEGYKRVKQALASAEVCKPTHPLRVGIVGEFYTAMDEFSNLQVERKLSDLGVEVHRWMTLSNRTLHYAGENNLQVKIKDYANFTMGPTSTANIWAAKNYAERGFDGIVHIKSANCTPEIDVMAALQNLSEDYKIPVLYLTFDAQTSDVGLMTRIEAFYDMLSMRKKVLV